MDLLTGAVLGFLSGLGVGGGSLLMLWLTEVRDMDLQQAGAVNLAFYLPAAGLACFLGRKRLPWIRIVPAACTGCLSAVLFSRLNIPTDLLKLCFGLLMLTVGIREIRAKKQPPGKSPGAE